MQDYTYIRDTGERVPVARMTDEEISSCLSSGVEIQYTDAELSESVSSVMERLRIEVVARRLP